MGRNLPKDYPDWDAEHVLKHSGEGWSCIRVIQDPAEGGVNIFFVQDYVTIRVPLVKTPDVNAMAQ
jgi:hypothetical protein